MPADTTKSTKVIMSGMRQLEIRTRRMVNDFRSEGVDTLELKTDSPYMPALQRFFKTRERRRV